MTTRRVARCACGQLSVTCEGEPEVIVACNCTWCQRRSGSPFGVAAYYKREAVAVSGASKTFRRGVERSDRTLTNQFCPECGGTIYWELDLRPQHIGVSVGSFADPSFAAPIRAIWTQHKHDWVAFPSDMPTFTRTASS